MHVEYQYATSQYSAEKRQSPKCRRGRKGGTRRKEERDG
jgi:hypothetical protein